MTNAFWTIIFSATIPGVSHSHINTCRIGHNDALFFRLDDLSAVADRWCMTRLSSRTIPRASITRWLYREKPHMDHVVLSFSRHAFSHWLLSHFHCMWPCMCAFLLFLSLSPSLTMSLGNRDSNSELKFQWIKAVHGLLIHCVIATRQSLIYWISVDRQPRSKLFRPQSELRLFVIMMLTALIDIEALYDLLNNDFQSTCDSVRQRLSLNRRCWKKNQWKHIKRSVWRKKRVSFFSFLYPVSVVFYISITLQMKD